MFLVPTDPLLQKLFDAAEKDGGYQEVVKAIREDAQVSDPPDVHPAKQLSNVWACLSIHEDVLMVYDLSCILVPKAARAGVFQDIHASHSRLAKTTKTAGELYFWHAMNNEIKNIIESCDKCQELKPRQQQQPLVLSFAGDPMEQVGVNLFKYGGHQSLLMVDR